MVASKAALRQDDTPWGSTTPSTAGSTRFTVTRSSIATSCRRLRASTSLSRLGNIPPGGAPRRTIAGRRWGGQPAARPRAHPVHAQGESPIALLFAQPAQTVPHCAIVEDLILLGCVKSKRTARCAAKDLYDSALWKGRRRHAEATGKPWAILCEARSRHAR